MPAGNPPLTRGSGGHGKGQVCHNLCLHPVVSAFRRQGKLVQPLKVAGDVHSSSQKPAVRLFRAEAGSWALPATPTGSRSASRCPRASWVCALWPGRGHL